MFGLEPASARDDIEDALEEADASGDFTPQERAILKNVLALNEVKVADLMVPRADIVAVSVEVTLGELLAIFRTAAHSRLPVYGDTLDDPRGMVHIRDFIDFLASEPSFGLVAEPAKGDATGERKAVAELGMNTPLSAAHILRPVLFAPPSMPALDLLVKMQASRTHMALVIDEYGGTDGLVSIEDVVELIVGDIEDEHDEADRPQIAAAGDGDLHHRGARKPRGRLQGARRRSLDAGRRRGRRHDRRPAHGNRWPRAEPRRNRRRPGRPRIRSA